MPVTARFDDGSLGFSVIFTIFAFSTSAIPNLLGLSTSHNKTVASKYDLLKLSTKFTIGYCIILSPRKTRNFSLLTNSLHNLIACAIPLGKSCSKYVRFTPNFSPLP